MIHKLPPANWALKLGWLTGFDNFVWTVLSGTKRDNTVAAKRGATGMWRITKIGHRIAMPEGHGPWMAHDNQHLHDSHSWALPIKLQPTLKNWSVQEDLNLWPPGPEPDAASRLSYIRIVWCLDLDSNQKRPIIGRVFYQLNYQGFWKWRNRGGHSHLTVKPLRFSFSETSLTVIP